VIGLLPVTGIPLPFISFGGSSLVITMAAAGILVNMARQGALVGVPALEHRSTRAGARRRATHGARVAVGSAGR
jgi:cell division protein FtsW